MEATQCRAACSPKPGVFKRCCKPAGDHDEHGSEDGGTSWSDDSPGAFRVRLVVRTARLGAYSGPDALNVTRGSGGAAGEPFAPTWELLAPFKSRAKANGGAISAADWIQYVGGYTAEMRQSYRSECSTWNTLLARESVVLLCYCPDPFRCHRGVLAGILAKLGAEDQGEVPAPAPPQLEIGAGDRCRPFVHRDTAGAVVGGGFICGGGSRRKCATAGCTSKAPYLCDYPLDGVKAGKTCDRPICRRCVRELARDTHFCPIHHDMAQREVIS